MGPRSLPGDYVDHFNFDIFGVEWSDLKTIVFLSELLCVELLLLLLSLIFIQPPQGWLVPLFYQITLALK